MEKQRRISITIQPSGGKERVLTVEDAMRQILDIIEVLVSPSRLREGRMDVSWGLVKASTNSPLNVEIAPFGKEQSILPPDELAIVYQDAEIAAEGIVSIIEDRSLPQWLDKAAGEAAKRVAKRNLNGIGLTQLSGDLRNEVTLNPIKSGIMLEVLDFFGAPDLGAIGKHQSRGEASGRMVRVGEYYGKPAFWLKDKSGNEIVCTLNDELVDLVGGETRLRDVWQNRRMTIRGVKHYDKTGKLLRLEATSEPEPVEHTPVNLHAIIDRDFTGGLSASDYIRKIRGES